MMSDTKACLNDLSYIPLNNEQNEPTQGDIGETSNEAIQAIRNKFEELYASVIEKLYPVVTIWKDSNTSRKKVPKKVLCYFSIIPRLQRLYKSSHTTKKMTWHATGNCTKPGKDIDVYLRSLIDDLKDLWAKPGVKTIDIATG
nr:hypothetical protein [Tanacetum cinerariifolium]